MQPAKALLQQALIQQRLSGWPGLPQWRAAAAFAHGSGARALSGAAAPAADAPPKLSDIMHVDALASKSPDEVEAIWLQFHEDPKQRRVADVMAAEEFRQMRVRQRGGGGSGGWAGAGALCWRRTAV